MCATIAYLLLLWYRSEAFLIDYNNSYYIVGYNFAIAFADLLMSEAISLAKG